jgi:hypothetical protein
METGDAKDNRRLGDLVSMASQEVLGKPQPAADMADNYPVLICTAHVVAYPWCAHIIRLSLILFQQEKADGGAGMETEDAKDDSALGVAADVAPEEVLDKPPPAADKPAGNSPTATVPSSPYVSRLLFCRL